LWVSGFWLLAIGFRSYDGAEAADSPSPIAMGEGLG
jgi:hypothetical protein